MLVDKQSELMSDLLFTIHQHGGDDVTWKPSISNACTSTRKRSVPEVCNWYQLLEKKKHKCLKSLQSSFSILRPACVLLSVCSLHFTLTQSVFYPWSTVCFLHWPDVKRYDSLRNPGRFSAHHTSRKHCYKNCFIQLLQHCSLFPSEKSSLHIVRK